MDNLDTWRYGVHKVFDVICLYGFLCTDMIKIILWRLGPTTIQFSVHRALFDSRQLHQNVMVSEGVSDGEGHDMQPKSAMHVGPTAYVQSWISLP
jgi:hypothetical protein